MKRLRRGDYEAVLAFVGAGGRSRASLSRPPCERGSVRRGQAGNQPRLPARRASVMASVHSVAFQKTHGDIDVLLAGKDLRGDAVRTKSAVGLLAEEIQNRVLRPVGERCLAGTGG